MVKLCNAPTLKREMVVHKEGEIMPTEHDPTMELSMVSMDLTLLHCPLCLRPLKPLGMRFEYTSSVRLIEQGASFLIDVLFD